jgi:ribosomal protein L7Ae-like RNA K-turn-binding protein
VSEEVTAESRMSGLLGLARRAGGVTAGTEAVREAIRAGQARLVVVAADASPAQSGKIRRTLAGHPVHHVVWGSRVELGAAVGMAPLSAIAVSNSRLATEMMELLGSRTVESFSGVEA